MINSLTCSKCVKLSGLMLVSPVTRQQLGHSKLRKQTSCSAFSRWVKPNRDALMSESCLLSPAVTVVSQSIKQSLTLTLGEKKGKGAGTLKAPPLEPSLDIDIVRMCSGSNHMPVPSIFLAVLM
jgi:hypothetical protein